MSLRAELESRVQSWAAANFPTIGQGPWIRSCAETRHGHFQTHLPMVAAKRTGGNPREIAERLAEECLPPVDWEKPTVAGAGFVNYRATPKAVAQAVQSLRTDPALGVKADPQSETIVVDFSSPNIAKSMHVGHIRSTLLGDTLSRLLTRLGHRVIRMNHLGDWGTQFGKLLLAYRAAGRPEIKPETAIQQLEDFYKLGHQEAESDPSKMDQARAELAALQSGDPERRQDWEHFCQRSAEHFRKVYHRLGVTFDLEKGESSYHAELPGIVEELLFLTIAEKAKEPLSSTIRRSLKNPSSFANQTGHFFTAQPT